MFEEENEVLTCEASPEENDRISGAKVDVMPDENEKLEKFRRKIEEEGYQYEVFPSLSEVAKAIKLNIPVNGIDISEKINDSNFRFLTEDNPELSYELSEAFSISSSQTYEKGYDEGYEKGLEDGKVREKQISEEAKGKSLATRIAKANEFALKLKKKVDELKEEEHVSTYRDIIDVLNRRKIPTAQNKIGSWQLKTLHDTLKRAERLEELGMTP
ncbi:hypothetical protein BWI93_25025 [Siphonobacter sp. BAB-5385]|uniref:hypothetical protein n=1 Tax=Siphonobacter sp. BAB-5385 TaxID=1864822 RepID=UPI000B9E6F69|nr:hypothetical protein [Siphonobacter sp. BAB-5385]OZI05531.1 hypothetical protein BWI93_25025 [Siphonobacter sp. BAB-5385]